MNDKTHEFLDLLVGEVKDKKTLLELKDELFKRGVESLLSAEMDLHLGYDKGQAPIEDNIRNGFSKKTLKTSAGEVRIEVPRDRKSSFDPVTVPKHQTMGEEIEQVILSLYAKGMSNADVIDFVESTYGVKYSTSQVSVITNSLIQDIREWQCRPLEDQYAVVWIDGIHYKIRQEGKVISKAAMIVLGINTA